MKSVVMKAALLLSALVVAACGATASQPEGASGGAKQIAEGEVCPVINPGPEVCPDGCKWNGTECRALRPIVIFDIPAPTSTATATKIEQPAPSTP
ncbi:MAG: hypothetical protein U0441_01205 [Polyangiaceae bacterium]